MILRALWKWQEISLDKRCKSLDRTTLLSLMIIIVRNSLTDWKLCTKLPVLTGHSKTEGQKENTEIYLSWLGLSDFKLLYHSSFGEIVCLLQHTSPIDCLVWFWKAKLHMSCCMVNNQDMDILNALDAWPSHIILAESRINFKLEVFLV